MKFRTNKAHPNSNCNCSLCKTYRVIYRLTKTKWYVGYLSVVAFIVAMLSFSSCAPAPPDPTVWHRPVTIIPEVDYDIYIIDGCEYVVVGVGYGQTMSHKGNCKNKIHEYKKTQQ